MKLASRTLAAIEPLFSGDPVDTEDRRIARYRSGRELQSFFAHLIPQGLEPPTLSSSGSRGRYVTDVLTLLNGTDHLSAVIEAALHPREFIDTAYDHGEAAAHVHKYLRYDDAEVVSSGRGYRIRTSKVPEVEVDSGWSATTCELTREFIDEQLRKCDQKVVDEDYAGAITNARSLVEAVLGEIERRIERDAPEYDGDLPKLYKRVRSHLNLDPKRADVDASLQIVLRGLANIVDGLAPMRNRMSDAHPHKYRPSEHHARLAVNAAKTLVDFIYRTFEYQVLRGTISTHAT